MKAEHARDTKEAAFESLPVWHPGRLLATFISMIGCRLDLTPAVAFGSAAGIVLTATLGFLLTGSTLENLYAVPPTNLPARVPSLIYLIGTWVAYYIGHSLFYTLGLHRKLRDKLGPERAYEVYSVCLGVMFFNLLWCQFPFLSITANTIDLPAETSQLFLVGLFIFVASFPIKLWATLHLGLDGYYYRDMFLEERVEGGAITSGPYAYLSDPMYSLGYCQIYAGPIFAQSLEGLIAAVIFHASIFVFHLVVERPFVRRMYGTPQAAE